MNADRRFFLKLGASALTTASLPYRIATAQDQGFGLVGILSIEAGAGLQLTDISTGAKIFTFATDGTPLAAWGTTLPGVAIVQTERSLAIVNANDGSTLAVALPQAVATAILPKSIQFRGSNGHTKLLIGTWGFGADTYLLDLPTGERTAVIGLLQIDTPPVSLQNVALAADDRHLLVWDGRTTWIVDLVTRMVRTAGTSGFTFSAGFSQDGSQLVYSQQLSDGTTELRLQDSDGSNDFQLFPSDDILVSLWLPTRNAMLLDERTDEGGTLSIYEVDTGLRRELLTYSGATNIVQFSPDGKYGLIGIEGAAGRDWYRLNLSAVLGEARLLGDIQDVEVQPGFDFHADWAIGIRPFNGGLSGTIYGIELRTGDCTPLIEGLTVDVALAGVVVAPNGPGALVTIDSFTEYAVHFLDFPIGENRTVSLMKGGDAVIAPDASGFAVSFDLNTGGVATIVYDRDGQEGATFQGKALAWI